MDYIDERNRKEKLANSVIKRRNVVYTTKEQTLEQTTETVANQEEQQAILQRLRKEQQEKEESKIRVIERMVQERDRNKNEVEALMRERGLI